MTIHRASHGGVVSFVSTHVSLSRGVLVTDLVTAATECVHAPDGDPSTRSAPGRHVLPSYIEWR